MVEIGIRRGQATGATRYADLLRAVAGEDLQVDVYPAVPWTRLRERIVAGTWAATGYPKVPAPGLRSSVVHSIESVVVPRADGAPLVVTAHDVAALKDPEWVGKRVAGLKRLSWRRAATWDAIIVPSRATQQDVLDLGLPERRIHLIRHPVAEVFRRTPTTEVFALVDSLVSGRFVVFVGPPSVKKGWDTLLRAWSALSPGGRVALAWVTRSRENGMEAAARLLGLVPADLVILEGPTDETLAALYRRAVATIAPSRAEGFNAPIAESLASGTGCVASDIPAHLEFGSEGMVLVKPGDASSLRDALASLPEGRLPGADPGLPTMATWAELHGAVYRALCS